MSRLPMEGVRVADFTWAGVGGYCGLVWALMGAEVIKIEGNFRGGTQRRSNPVRRLGVRYGLVDELNSNKRSVVLNLKHPDGIALAKRLVAQCDMVAENFRPGVMDRLGLGYEALRQVKPDIVMLSMSANGATGPDREVAGYAGIFGALSGISHLIGYADGPPVELRLPSDMLAGSMGAFIGLAALYHQRSTGQGQHVDSSSRETLSTMIGDILLDCSVNGRSQDRRGNDDVAWAPHNCYPCRDAAVEGGSRGERERWVAIAVTTEEEWQGLVHALGAPPWAAEERFADAPRRWEHRQELDVHLAEWTRQREPEDIMRDLQAHGVAATQVMRPPDLLADPHLAERDAWQVCERKDGSPWVMFGPPWRYSDAPPVALKRAPEMGEDNQYVFGDLLGLGRDEIDRLVADQAIF